jgi:hypothetical protein
MKRAAIGLLLAKIESTYGTDPTPTQSANAIPVAGRVTYSAEGDHLTRDILDGTFDPIAGDVAMLRGQMEFEIELRGNRTDGLVHDISSGTVGDILDFDCLLKACDYTPTYTAETGSGVRDGYVTYNPTDLADVGDSVTLWFYTGGKVHKLNGCKGTFKINAQAGRYGTIRFTFRGIYVAIADATLPSAPVFVATKPPLFVKPSAADALLYAGVAPVFTKLDFDAGNRIEMRASANATGGIAGFVTGGRDASGSFDPEDVLEATIPWWTDWAAGTAQTLVARCGDSSGNRWRLTLAAQARSLSHEDRNGNLIKPVQFKVVKTSLTTATLPIALRFD